MRAGIIALSIVAVTTMAFAGLTPIEVPAERVRPVQRELWRFLGVWRVTGYCPCSKCCGKWADGVTANGTAISTCAVRIVAAPPGVPFGTRLWIDEVGVVVVTTGAVRFHLTNAHPWGILLDDSRGEPRHLEG